MTAQQQRPPAAGWYASNIPGQDRWWDGQQWTEHLQPTPQWAQPLRLNGGPERGWGRTQWIALAAALCAAVFLLWFYS